MSQLHSLNRGLILWRNPDRSYCYSVSSTALPWDSYFFKLTQPLIVSVREKGGKPDRKPYSLLYGLRNPYRNLKSKNSQDYAQKPQWNWTVMNSASLYISVTHKKKVRQTMVNFVFRVKGEHEPGPASTSCWSPTLNGTRRSANTGNTSRWSSSPRRNATGLRPRAWILGNILQCCGSGSTCFGPSGSTSQRYWSGSGSFYHHAKIVRKTLIPTILWLFLSFYLWKMM